jgi:hypothetical protein
MKDKKNWSSELNPEEVSVGLDMVSHKLNGKVVCLHSTMRYGVPDSMTLHLIKNFKDLGIKKLIITSFPISDEPEEWSELLEGEKYVIEKVPSKLAEDDNYSIAVEHFLAKHKEEFKVKDNSKQLAHIKMIKAADVVIGFPSVNILESYVKLLDRYNKNYIIGGYVNKDNFSDYLKAFEMRRFEITSVENMRYKEFFCEFNGSLIWMDNFDKVTPYYSTDIGYGYEEDEL